MANCIEFEGKEYSVNEFKTALLNGELERLYNAGKLKLDNAEKLFTNIKSQNNAIQEPSTRESVLRNERVQREGKLPRVGEENKSEKPAEESKSKPTEEKKSVLEKDIKEVSVDDILKELKEAKSKKLKTKDLSNDVLKSGDKDSIENYVQRAGSVLKTLFPNAKLETFGDTESYVKAGGTENTRGIGLLEKNGEHRILLNLEKISADNSGKTAYHEVIHPILYEAYTTEPEKLNTLWNDVANDLKDVKGMDKVFEHASLYDANERGMEGLTEFLAQVADGNIDLKEAKPSVIQKALDLINRVLDAIGVNYKFNNVKDFTEFAEKIKEAFRTGDAESLKGELKGTNIDKVYEQLEKTREEEPDKYNKLVDLLKQKLAEEVEAGNLTQEQADQILSENTAKPEYFSKERFSDLSKKERQRGAYNHLIDSKVDQDVIDKFKKEKDLKYPVADQGEAKKFGGAIIKSFGVDESLRLARLNTFHPSVNSAVFAEAIDHYRNEEIKAKEPQAKFDAAKKWADTFDEYAQLLTGAGQFSAYSYNFYKTSKLGFLLSAEKKFKEKQDWFINRDEKSINEAYDKLMEIPEFSDLFVKKVEEAKAKSKQTFREEQKKKISDAWDSIKLQKNQAYAIPVPIPIINGAIEAMKRATLLGYDAVNVVKDGIDYINKHFKEGWDEEKFRNDFTQQVENIYKVAEVSNQQRLDRYKESLRKQIKDLDEQISNKQRTSKDKKEFELDEEAKQLRQQRDEKRKELNQLVPLEKTAQKILDKWEKKLDKLTPEAKKQFASKVVNEIVQHGGLDRETFQRLYAESLGVPTLTPEMKQKLIDLGGKLNAVDEAKEALDKDASQENIDAYVKAIKEGEKASRQINDLLGEKDITLDRFLSIAKLNTLGVANLIMNPLYNVAYMPFRFGESMVMTSMDYALKYLGFPRKEGEIYENVIYKQLGYFPGMAEGLQKSIIGIIKGEQQYDFFQKSTRQNITPKGSIKEIIAHHKGEKPLTTKEYANALMEAFPTMGVTAAIVSRALQVGDLPFRFAAERATAESIARQRGLTGLKKQAFLLNPDEKSQELIKQSGDVAVQSQSNAVTSYLNRVSSFLKFTSDEKLGSKLFKGAAKIIGASTQPFLKIPLNNAITVTQLIVPELAVAQGMYHAIKGERTEALRLFARAAVGYGIGAAFSQLASLGMITSTSEDQDKINTSIYKEDISGGNHLNVTALKRYINGDNPKEQNGDLKINLNSLGVAGAIMQMYGAKYDKLPPSEWEKLSYLNGLTDRLTSGFVEGMKNNVFGNTSTFISALSDGNVYSINKWLRGSTGVLENAFDPSWLSMATRISDGYRTDYSAMNTIEQLEAQLKERIPYHDQLPAQITVWGDKRSDAPKGRNSFVYNYLDITKAREVDTSDFGYNILALYDRTKEDEVIPSRPQKTIRGNHSAITLTPQQYEQYQILVGQARKNLVQNLMGTPDYYNASDDIKIKLLQNQYKQGYYLGKYQMMQLYKTDFQKAGVLPQDE